MGAYMVKSVQARGLKSFVVITKEVVVIVNEA
jgi:hypothetical protein